MKAALLAWAFLIFFVGKNEAEGIANIPADDQVILNLKEATWTPSVPQTKKALAAIQVYLKQSADERKVDPVLTAGSDKRRKWIAEEAQKILADKQGYRVQFWGTTEEGRPVVYCNFFPARGDDQDGFEYWRSKRVQVLDGGYGFWFATYDPKAKAVVMFQSNGYAFYPCNPNRLLVALPKLMRRS